MCSTVSHQGVGTTLLTVTPCYLVYIFASAKISVRHVGVAHGFSKSAVNSNVENASSRHNPRRMLEVHDDWRGRTRAILFRGLSWRFKEGCSSGIVFRVQQMRICIRGCRSYTFKHGYRNL
jgi:hypothetical protein